MSFPTAGGQAGGELENAIVQILELVLRNMTISSAGGDSPKINTVLDFPVPSGFGEILDTAVRIAVLRHMEDNGLLSTGGVGGGENASSGMGGRNNPLSIARGGVGAINDPASFFLSATNITKLIPIITTLIAAPAFAMMIRNILIGPGMPFDPRFRRDIGGEVLSTVEREEKAGLRQGLVIVRITSTPTLRGEQGIGQTGQVGLTGIARYDNDFESFQKGIL